MSRAVAGAHLGRLGGRSVLGLGDACRRNGRGWCPRPSSSSSRSSGAAAYRSWTGRVRTQPSGGGRRGRTRKTPVSRSPPFVSEMRIGRRPCSAARRRAPRPPRRVPRRPRVVGESVGSVSESSMVKTLGTIGGRGRHARARSSMARRIALAISTGCTSAREGAGKDAARQCSSFPRRGRTSPSGPPPPSSSVVPWSVPASCRWPRSGPAYLMGLCRSGIRGMSAVPVLRLVHDRCAGADAARGALWAGQAMTVRRTPGPGTQLLSGRGASSTTTAPDEVATTGDGRRAASALRPGDRVVAVHGEIEHRDSLGTQAMVRPGEVNLMTAGAASPTPSSRRTPRRCFMGAALGGAAGRGATLRRPSSITCRRWSPRRLGCGRRSSSARSSGRTRRSRPPHAAGGRGGARSRRLGDPGFSRGLPEVAVLLDTGTVTYAGRELAVGDLAVVEAGTRHTPWEVVAGESGARVVVARWSALRGGGRDVVELRGPQP